jgi:hypothetical protein
VKRTCAYPGCGGGFEAKRSDARYCSDTCRAKASKERARGRREGAGGGPRREGAAVVAGAGDAGALTEGLAAMEQRLAAAEAGVGRAEADRAGWNKVRDQLQAALARVDGGGPASAEKVAAAVRAEVGAQFAKLVKRLDGLEAAQTALREDLTKLRGLEKPAKAAGLMMVGKALGDLATRVGVVERDILAFSEAIAGGEQEEAE